MIKRTVLNRLFSLIVIVFKITAVLSLGFLGGKYSVYDPQIYGVSQTDTLVIRAIEYENDLERDPQKAPFDNGDEVNTLSLLFSGLVKVDEDGHVVPDLAEKWNISEDYLKYTFTIDSGARFGNGDSVKSSDVLYTIERAAASGSSYEANKSVRNILGYHEYNSGRTKKLTGVRAINDLTIEITLKKPAQGFLYDLATPSLYIVNKNDVAADSLWFQKPNGTGPYKVLDYKKTSHILLERKDDWYGVLPSHRNVLFIYQNYDFSGFAEMDVKQLYSTNAVDIVKMNYLNADGYQSTESPYYTELVTFRPWCFSFFSLNSDSGFFQNIHMRRAFNTSLQREVYVEKYYNGDAEISHSIFSYGMPGYSVRSDYAIFDSEYSLSEAFKAKQVNEKYIYGHDTGYVDSSSKEYEIIGQMVKRAFNAEITVLKVEPNIGPLPDSIRRDFDGSRYCTDNPDPANTVNNLIDARNYAIGDRDNTLLDLYSAAEDIPNGQERVAKFQELEKLIMDQVPIVFTATPNDYFLIKPYVWGFNSRPGVALTIPEMRLDGKKLYLFGSMIQRTLIDYWDAISSQK